MNPRAGRVCTTLPSAAALTESDSHGSDASSSSSSTGTLTRVSTPGTTISFAGSSV